MERNIRQIIMAQSKFKTGDYVRIISNSLQPQFQGKIGKIKKAFPTFSEDHSDVREFVYRIEVNGEVLKGIAKESDLQSAQ